MALVDYSDSDSSDNEQAAASKPSITSKPTFQKVVDRSNPGKIRVSLPQTVKEENHRDEPPAKRAKTGGGGAFSGFNSFLPAPKRANQPIATDNTSSTRKIGLTPGVSLKTGSAPGFSRDKEPENDYEDQEGEAQPAGGSGLNLPPPKSTSLLDQKPAEEVKVVGKLLMFKPLSVSRKPVKKKKKQTSEASSTTSPFPTTPSTKTEMPIQKAKVSLFSMASEPDEPLSTPSTGVYKPMLYESSDLNEGEDGETEDNLLQMEPTYEDYTPNTNRMAPPAVPTPPLSQSLDDIAGDLNLTDSQRRQLFGRQKVGRMQSATKVINFNTDQEYLHNEELRAAGEQVVRNPVRSIAPGKHSLKQLVNAAQSQKEALEESFAKGKSNRAEASSRYGW